MAGKNDSDLTPANVRTAVNRKSGRELIVTRTFNAPVRIVFQAWVRPELFKRWCSRWLTLHLVLSVILYVLLALHIWAGIHFGLRWFS